MAFRIAATLMMATALVAAAGCATTAREAPPEVAPQPPQVTAHVNADPAPPEVPTAVTTVAILDAEPVPTATASMRASPGTTDNGGMDKELVQRLRAAKPEDKSSLTERHKKQYGDGRSAEERDAAAAEGVIAGGAVDAALAAVEMFRSKYPGSVHQVRLDGLLARKQRATMKELGR
jgi:hypothetical protein